MNYSSHLGNNIKTFIMMGSRDATMRTILFIIFLIICFYIYKKINYKFIWILIFFIIYFYTINLTQLKKAKENSIPINHILEKGKTGDLILFRTHNNYDLSAFLLYRFFPTILSGDPWSHVGILYRRPMDNKLFIWECSGYDLYDYNSNSYKDGVIMSLFEDRIKNYNGWKGWIPSTKKINDDIFINSCKKYQNYTYVKNIKGVFYPSEKDGITCVKFVSLVLEDNNLLCKKPYMFNVSHVKDIGYYSDKIYLIEN